MRQVAARAGFSFEAEGNLKRLRGIAEFWLFEHGSGHARNVMTTSWQGRPVIILEFVYTTGGKTQHVTGQTVAVFPGAGPTLPDMRLRPTGPFQALAKVAGFQDIDFPSDPQFSRLYTVEGANEAAIRHSLAPALAFLAAATPWAVEVVRGHVAVYRPHDVRDAEGIVPFVDQASGVVRALTTAPRGSATT